MDFTNDKIGHRSYISNNIPVHNFIFDNLGRKPLSTLIAITTGIIFEEFLYFFEILKYTLYGNINFNQTNYNNKIIDEKYITILKSPKMRSSLPISIHYEKVLNDTNGLIDILKITLSEVKYNGQFDSLENMVNKTIQIQMDTKKMKENYQLWSEVCNEIKKLIKTNQNTNAQEVQEITDTIESTKLKIVDLKSESASKMEYIKQWERNKVKEHKLFLLKNENELYETIMKYDKVEDNEDLIFEKLTEYFQKYIEKIEMEIPKWNSRYNDEFELLQQDIIYLEKDIEDQKTQIQELTLIKDKRQEFINDCISKREETRMKKQRRHVLNASATKIQAMWKGYMVRHRLGQYDKLWKKLNIRKKKKQKSSKNKKKKPK